MTIDMMQRAIQLFNDKSCGTGATLVEISDAEVRLGTKLPESYRAFLAKQGWGRFAHQELYGLGADVPSYLDLISNTIAERSMMSPSIPITLIPIMNDGAGNHFCLDTQRWDGSECPVVFWDHELSVDQAAEVVASSFDEWLTVSLNRLQS